MRSSQTQGLETVPPALITPQARIGACPPQSLRVLPARHPQGNKGGPTVSAEVLQVTFQRGTMRNKCSSWGGRLREGDGAPWVLSCLLTQGTETTAHLL